MSRRYVELAVERVAETDHAILVDDGSTKVWLPKSQVEISEGTIKGLYCIVLSESLATEKGLI